MATPPLNPAEIARRCRTIEDCLREGYVPFGQSGGRGSAVSEAARRLGIADSTLAHCVRRGFVAPDWEIYQARDRAATPALDIPAAPKAVDPGALDRVLASLRKKPMALDEIAAASGVTKGQALDALEAARASGINLHEIDGKWSAEKLPVPPPRSDDFSYHSRPNHRFVFGCISDNHYCSKYERDDVAQDLYDRFAAAGVDRVFNAGNWIDGEAPFNKFDLKVHGLEPQVRYFAKHYPRRDGIATYAIAGEDHEGWLGRREAIDVGRFTERLMRESGRDDWHNLGFMEAFVPLINSETGARSQLLVMHPGGGSSYATSYRPQKIVESLEGGEKPAVLLIGHYHKLSVNLVRNVWTLQIGCTQDQTVFMRKKNIDAHIGGMIVELEQDPKSGAIVACKTEIIRYFNQDYYNERWSNSGDVVLPQRKANVA